MIRRLVSVAAALLLVAGFAATASAGIYLVPASGGYQGLDHQQRSITFTFDGVRVNDFKVDQHTIGSTLIHVDGWSERCSGGWCFRGQWQTNAHVVGSWRSPDGHWTAWSADLPGQGTAYQGQYVGTDHLDQRVRFVRSGPRVVHFSIAGATSGPAHVANGSWSETCSGGICFKGHWQNDTHVVGSWRHPGGHWIAWEARAFTGMRSISAAARTGTSRDR